MNEIFYNIKYKLNLYHRYFFWNKHKCVYIHVPKAAGTSINLAIYGRTLGHYSAIEIQSKFPKLFRDSFTFALVRNPWDRIYSAYKFARVGKTESMGVRNPEKYQVEEFNSFESFVVNWLKFKDVESLDFIFQPQFKFVCDENGNLMIDFVGKLEKLDEDMNFVKKKLNTHFNLSHSNKTYKLSNYQDAYKTQEMIDIVRDLYSKDIELFGYDF
jgi:hypothetical protein